MSLTASQRKLISQSVDVARIAIQYGFVPFVVYMGFRAGPEPLPNGQIVPLTLASLLWG